MITQLLIFIVRCYRLTVSPFLGLTCRFYPSCSVYMVEALKTYGALKGSWLGVKRLCKCHPWHPGGHDPVLKKVKETNDTDDINDKQPS